MSPQYEQEGTLIVGLSRAAAALYGMFGALIDADYLPGKTLFRDALCSRFGFSQLEAEEMCDSLEQAGLIRFVRSEDGVGWHIHASGESEMEAGRA